MNILQKFVSVFHARWFQFAAIPLLVLVWFAATDPSGGADTMLRVQLWAQAFLVTGIAYLVGKAILGRASSQDLYDATMGGNVAAGIAYTGVCLLRALVLIGLLQFFAMVQR
jgi:hypothetical protein